MILNHFLTMEIRGCPEKRGNEDFKCVPLYPDYPDKRKNADLLDKKYPYSRFQVMIRFKNRSASQQF
ncbi:MAG: hypothetical protein A2V65_11060 [Deltaproteobacteria bacterium RBG_13_49_15]|nr:MAG: hypothetical protein A2V65_11060 [Deltaproteobacteria bacterium RBG_13_49_15]